MGTLKGVHKPAIKIDDFIKSDFAYKAFLLEMTNAASGLTKTRNRAAGRLDRYQSGAMITKMEERYPASTYSRHLKYILDFLETYGQTDFSAFVARLGLTFEEAERVEKMFEKGGYSITLDKNVFQAFSASSASGPSTAKTQAISSASTAAASGPSTAKTQAISSASTAAASGPSTAKTQAISSASTAAASGPSTAKTQAISSASTAAASGSSTAKTQAISSASTAAASGPSTAKTQAISSASTAAASGSSTAKTQAISSASTAAASGPSTAKTQAISSASTAAASGPSTAKTQAISSASTAAASGSSSAKTQAISSASTAAASGPSTAKTQAISSASTAAASGPSTAKTQAISSASTAAASSSSTASSSVFQLPQNWSSRENQLGHVKVQLAEDSEEFQEVLAKIRPTNSCHRIINKISRIENARLYLQYQVQKQSVTNSCPPGIVIERELFHGTREANVDSISSGGFDRSFAGKSIGASLGAGTYFSTNFNYSSNRRIAADGHVFLCRVIVGESCKGSADLRVPPFKRGGVADVRYESAVDFRANPQTYVVWPDAAAYPEYLLEFKQDKPF